MDRIDDLKAIIDKVERNNTVIINSQDDFDTYISHELFLPKYAAINCEELYINFMGKYNVHNINNWDFTHCEMLHIDDLSGLRINNTTLNNTVLTFECCKHITHQGINISINKIQDCLYSTFSAKDEIPIISDCLRCRVDAPIIETITDCKQCDFEAHNVPKIKHCVYCLINFYSKDTSVFTKGIFNDCLHCRFVAFDNALCENGIIRNSEYCLLKFKKNLMFNGNDIIKHCKNINVEYACEKNKYKKVNE